MAARPFGAAGRCSAQPSALEVLLVSGWLAGWWLLWRVPALTRRASAARISVIVPCRNEASRLPALLSSLSAQAPPPFEVIVVDDSSEDRTTEIARVAGARVVTAPSPPPGWAGKPWACAQGACAATGEVLVFLDADVTLGAPDVLGRLAAEVEDRGGLVSVQPFHETRQPYERLSAYFNLVALMGVDAFGPLRSRLRPAGAFGACLACERGDYERAGGHEAVRDDVLDDLALSRRFERVALFGGHEDVAFRMYPGGLAQLVEGWTKNMAAGAARVRPATSALVAVWVTASLVAAAQPLAYVAFAIQLAALLPRAGRFRWATAVLFPLPLAFFVGVFGRSLVHVFVRREVRWSGRTIATGRR